jgi:hypothetical protein
MSQNNLELLGNNDGTLSLNYWDNIHGDDVYLQFKEGKCFLEKYIEDENKFILVECDLIEQLKRILNWSKKMSQYEQACDLVSKARASGIETVITGHFVTLWIKPHQAKIAKELLKDYELSCRVNVERARKPTRRYSSHFDFIKNYPVAKSGK